MTQRNNRLAIKTRHEVRTPISQSTFYEKWGDGNRPPWLQRYKANVNLLQNAYSLGDSGLHINSFPLDNTTRGADAVLPPGQPLIMEFFPNTTLSVRIDKRGQVCRRGPDCPASLVGFNFPRRPFTRTTRKSGRRFRVRT
jgi:hypothetical protein